jgi:hypothetical protein
MVIKLPSNPALPHPPVRTSAVPLTNPVSSVYHLYYSYRHTRYYGKGGSYNGASIELRASGRHTDFANCFSLSQGLRESLWNYGNYRYSWLQTWLGVLARSVGARLLEQHGNSRLR